jgi:hypothetical protein
MTMLSSSQHSQEPRRSDHDGQQEARDNDFPSSELPLHRWHTMKPEFRLETLRKSQGLHWKDSWDSSSSNNSELDEDDFEERSIREEGENDDGSPKNRVLPGSPSYALHAHVGTPMGQGHNVHGTSPLAFISNYPTLGQSSSLGRRRKRNETTFATLPVSDDPRLITSEIDIKSGVHKDLLPAVLDDFFGQLQRKQSDTRLHVRRHSFPYLSSEPKRERSLIQRNITPTAVKVSTVPSVSPSVSRYRSISFGYPIVPAFSNPRLPASPSVKRMQLSTMPGLSGPLGRTLRSSAIVGIEKTTERPIEEVIPNFEYLHFSLLRHTLRREVAPDEILSREDCLAVMNSKLSQVVLKKEDTSFNISSMHHLPPFQRNFLCDMHTSAAEQLQHINKEMRKHAAVHLRLRQEDNPRRMRISHKLKSGDIDMMVVPRVEETEETFSDYSHPQREAVTPAVVAIAKSKTNEESDYGSRSIEASISIVTSIDADNCENESKYDHEVIQVYDADSKLLGTSPISNYCAVNFSSSLRLASDVPEKEESEEKMDVNTGEKSSNETEEISTFNSAIDSTSVAAEDVSIGPIFNCPIKHNEDCTTVHKTLKGSSISSEIISNEPNPKLSFPKEELGSNVTCTDSKGPDRHATCMMTDRSLSGGITSLNVKNAEETNEFLFAEKDFPEDKPPSITAGENISLPNEVDLASKQVIAESVVPNSHLTDFSSEAECQQKTSKIDTEDELVAAEPQPKEPPTIGRVTQLSFNAAISFDSALTSNAYKNTEGLDATGSSADVSVDKQLDFSYLPRKPTKHCRLSSDDQCGDEKDNLKDDPAESSIRTDEPCSNSTTPEKVPLLPDVDTPTQESHIQPSFMPNNEKCLWNEGTHTASPQFYPFFQVSPAADPSLIRMKRPTQISTEQPNIMKLSDSGHHIMSYSPSVLGRQEENSNIGEILCQHGMNYAPFSPECGSEIPTVSNTFTEGSESAASFPHVSEHHTPGRFRRRLENAIAVKKNVDGNFSDNAASPISAKNDASPDKSKQSAPTQVANSGALPPHMIRRKLLLPDLSDVLTGEDMTDVDLLDNYMYCNHNQDIGRFPAILSRQTDRNDSSSIPAVPTSMQLEKTDQLREAVALTMSISASAQSTYSQRSQVNPSVNSLPEDDFEHPFARSSRPLGLIGLVNAASVENFCESSRLQRGEFCNVDNISSSCNSISHAMDFVLGFLPSADDLSRSCSNGKEQHHQHVSCKDAVLQCWNDVHANSVTVCDVKANQAPCGPATIYRQTSAKNKCRVHGQLFTPPTLKLRSQSLTSLPEDDIPRFNSNFDSLPSRSYRLNNGEEDYSYRNPRWAMAMRGSDGSPHPERCNGRPPLIPLASSDFPYEGSFEGRHHPGLPIARRYFQNLDYSSQRHIPRHLFQPDRANLVVKSDDSPKAIILNEVKDNEYFFGQTYEEDRLFLASQTNSF